MQHLRCYTVQACKITDLIYLSPKNTRMLNQGLLPCHFLDTSTYNPTNPSFQGQSMSESHLQLKEVLAKINFSTVLQVVKHNIKRTRIFYRLSFKFLQFKILHPPHNRLCVQRLDCRGKRGSPEVGLPREEEFTRGWIAERKGIDKSIFPS